MCHLLPLADASAGVAAKCLGCYSWLRDLPGPQDRKLKPEAMLSISLPPLCSESCERSISGGKEGPLGRQLPQDSTGHFLYLLTLLCSRLPILACTVSSST